MKIVIIAAVAKNGVIGRKGEIPWRIHSDMRHFVEVTAGHPVIMGRKTYQSIPQRFRPLNKNRTSIVMTRHPSRIEFDTTGIKLVSSPDEALAEALAIDNERVFIAGGQEIYELLLPQANTLMITEVNTHPIGDSFFPLQLNGENRDWQLIERRIKAQGEKDEYAFSFLTFVRVANR